MIRAITPTLRRHIHSATTDAVDRIYATTWDACVIGSGPGGAVAAATLAEAGWRVLLVERGPFEPVETMNFQLLEMSQRLSHLDLTAGARIVLHQGNVLGGGSLVWGAMAVKPLGFVFDEWAQRSGANTVTERALEPHYAYVARVMSMTRQHPSQANRSNAIVRQMAGALGCGNGLEIVHRYTEGCRGVGLCTVGCAFNEKGTMTNSFLPMALASGNLSVLTGCEAVAFDGDRSTAGFKATRLLAVARDPRSSSGGARVAIAARHFIVAAGAIHSSALLMRTRALKPRVDRHKVSLQPHATVHALFDEPVTSAFPDGVRRVPLNGVPAIYMFTGMLEDRGYAWFASALHPASLAASTSHLPPREHSALVSRFHYTCSVSITVRDNPYRSRIAMCRRRPRLDYVESSADRERLRRCLVDVSRGLLGAGARQVFLPLLQPPTIKRPRDLQAIEGVDLSYDRALLYADHLSGGNPLGSTPRIGVTDPAGRVFGSENVYVADASLLPSACGVGPSWTLMALSRFVALSLLGRSPRESPSVSSLHL